MDEVTLFARVFLFLVFLGLLALLVSVLYLACCVCPRLYRKRLSRESAENEAVTHSDSESISMETESNPPSENRSSNKILTGEKKNIYGENRLLDKE